LQEGFQLRHKAVCHRDRPLIDREKQYYSYITGYKLPTQPRASIIETCPLRIHANATQITPLQMRLSGKKLSCLASAGLRV
jgi:hypothetical protein